jgi:TetR/AcrR family acrAB operon transcriptional repressor
MTEDDRRRSDNQEREQRILDAAAALLLRYGYDKTTISDIAEEAGISKAAIYLHFAKREELFQALISREFSEFAEDWLARVEADTDGGTMYAMLGHTLTALADKPLIQAIYGKNRRILGDLLKQIDPRMFSFSFEMRRQFVQAMQDAGTIRSDVDAEAMAYIVTMLSFGFILMDELAEVENPPSLERIIYSLTDLFGRALTPDGGGNQEAGKRIIRDLINRMKDRPTNWFDLM